MFLIRLKPDDFPEHLSEVFSTVLNGLTNQKQVGSENVVRATTSQLTVEEATKLAERIVRLYSAVEQSRQMTMITNRVG
jgi:deoxyinosine 3'endonuclease (endonuclease V)